MYRTVHLVKWKMSYNTVILERRGTNYRWYFKGFTLVILMKMLIMPPAMPIQMQEINFTCALIHAYRGSIIEEINQSHMEE